MGYATFGKGYRVWIPKTREIIEFRDCVSKENAKHKEASNSHVINEERKLPELIEMKSETSLDTKKNEGKEQDILHITDQDDVITIERKAQKEY